MGKFEVENKFAFALLAHIVANHWGLAQEYTSSINGRNVTVLRGIKKTTAMEELSNTLKEIKRKNLEEGYDFPEGFDDQLPTPRGVFRWFDTLEFHKMVDEI